MKKTIIGFVLGSLFFVGCAIANNKITSTNSTLSGKGIRDYYVYEFYTNRGDYCVMASHTLDTLGLQCDFSK